MENIEDEFCHDGKRHKFVFAGVVFSYGHKIPGSSAEQRILEDKFFCEVCLETKYINPRVRGNSYNQIIPGSFPK